MHNSPNGIISYAGLSRDTLFSAALKAQQDPRVPARFATLIALFPIELVQYMPYAGRAAAPSSRVSPSGFSIDPAEYHRLLSQQMPQLYEGDNRSRNFGYDGQYHGRGPTTVDQVWADAFPQYQPFQGEKLHIYPLGGGAQAVAVPESLYPRGGGVLRAQERRLGVCERAEKYAQYVRGRIEAGDAYDPELFASEYLRDQELAPLSLTQKELARILQELSLARSVGKDSHPARLYTENARRVADVKQYVPGFSACDCFLPVAPDKRNARLAQLSFADADYVSDFWIPYAALERYVSRDRMTLDVEALCRAYQIAPVYDPETLGGRYPDQLRVAVIRDPELTLLAADALNNPAYGDGNSDPEARQICLPDSAELLRRRKLSLEEASIQTENTAVPPAQYARMARLAECQETKGRLVDALYRRESALSRLDPDAFAFERAQLLLTDRVTALAQRMQTEVAQGAPATGYDEDIDYLLSKCECREARSDGAFEPDERREASIEGGYAMRCRVLRATYDDVQLPPEPEPLPKPVSSPVHVQPEPRPSQAEMKAEEIPSQDEPALASESPATKVPAVAPREPARMDSLAPKPAPEPRERLSAIAPKAQPASESPARRNPGGTMARLGQALRGHGEQALGMKALLCRSKTESSEPDKEDSL